MTVSTRLAVLNLDGRTTPPESVADEVDIRLVDPRVGVLPRTPYDRLLCEIAAVDAAERAIAEGCDAILVESFGDYGLAAIRSLTDVPVVGAGETAIQAAARRGRFAVITVWPRAMGHVYADRLAVVAGGSRCVAVHHVVEDDEIDRPGGGADLHRRALEGDADTTARVSDACRAAVERDLLDAVVLGCTCMSAMAAPVAAECPVPVIDPAAVGYELAIDLTRDAPDVSETGSKTRHAGRIARLVDGWLGEDADPPDESCGVCVTA